MVKKIVWVLIAVLTLGGGAAAWYMTSGIEVKTAGAERRDLEKLVTETGMVESKNAIEVVAKSGGQVNSVYVEEGDTVKSGDLLLKSDASAAAMDVAGIQAQAAGVRAQYETARELAQKNKKLYEEGAVSHDVYLQSQTAADQLQAQISALGYNAASVTESTGGGKVKAPISGVVTQVYVKAGEVVQPGAPILEISGIDDSYVKVNLIAEDADLVKVGMSVTLTNHKDEILCREATVRKVGLKAQDVLSELGITQKRVEVEIALPAGSSFRLGTEMDVKIQIEKRTAVLTIPEKALFQMDEKDCVYVVQEGKALLRQIEVGLSGEEEREVLSGLTEGDVVVLSPDSDLSDGARVKVLD